ncbi:DUF3307 domain-containing protein [Candidatus Peregrinibacteria bacterium]|nr:DUF3307 domain-containing protein [Candidatus Peregrinibacteria bacterium]
MIFLNLLLAHLLADFVLQPHKLVAWKFKSWKGTAAHASVHFAANLLVFLPFLNDIRVWLVFVAVSATHFAIDSIKIEKEKHGRHFLAYFCADQMAHLAVISLVAGLFLGFPLEWNIVFWGNSLGETLTVLGINLLILLTYVVEILIFQVKRMKNRSLLFEPNYKSMLKRAFLFSALYVIFLVFAVYHAAALGA